MPPVDLGQFQTCHVTQPEEERQCSLANVLVQTARDLDIGLLDDVRFVDPGGEPAAQSEPYHTLEPIMVLRKQGTESLLIAACGPMHQVRDLAGIARHGIPRSL